MKLITKNSKIHFDYNVIKMYSSGIVLFGGEVKSIKNNKASLNSSFVSIENNEAFLINCNIQLCKNCLPFDPNRKRKLLLNKKEIEELSKEVKNKGITIVPVSIYLEKNLIKLQIALARGKKKFDKRQSLKLKEAKREMKK